MMAPMLSSSCCVISKILSLQGEAGGKVSAQRCVLLPVVQRRDMPRHEVHWDREGLHRLASQRHSVPLSTTLWCGITKRNCLLGEWLFTIPLALCTPQLTDIAKMAFPIKSAASDALVLVSHQLRSDLIRGRKSPNNSDMWKDSAFGRCPLHFTLSSWQLAN